MRIPLAGLLVLLLLLGFVLYDVFDFAVGAWAIFLAILGLALGRLTGWSPGTDIDPDGD